MEEKTRFLPWNEAHIFRQLPGCKAFRAFLTAWGGKKFFSKFPVPTGRKIPISGGWRHCLSGCGKWLQNFLCRLLWIG